MYAKAYWDIYKGRQDEQLPLYELWSESDPDDAVNVHACLFSVSKSDLLFPVFITEANRFLVGSRQLLVWFELISIWFVTLDCNCFVCVGSDFIYNFSGIIFQTRKRETSQQTNQQANQLLLLLIVLMSYLFAPFLSSCLIILVFALNIIPDSVPAWRWPTPPMLV